MRLTRSELKKINKSDATLDVAQSDFCDAEVRSEILGRYPLDEFRKVFHKEAITLI